MKGPGPEGASAALILVLISAAFLMTATPLHVSASSVSLSGRYVMAFLACNTSVSTCSNPQNHVTHLAESNDSVNWTPVPGFSSYSGSVPDAIRRGNTIYIYNPNVLVRFHLDTGAQDISTTVGLRYANGTSATFVDPSLILDSAGTLHLFYLPGLTGGDPAQCPTGQSTCTKQIMSATEVSGSNGGAFIVDSGMRAQGTIQQCCFSDPAVFQGPAGYYLYVSEGQSVVAFQSSTLTGTYSSVPGLNGGVLVQQGTGGVPSGYYDNSSSSFLTYIAQGSTVETIGRASTSTISSPISGSSFSTVLSGSTFPGLGSTYTVGSPAIHLNAPGPSTTTSSSTSTQTTSSSTQSTSTSITSSTSSQTSSSSSAVTSSTTTASSTGSTSTTTSAASSTRSQTSASSSQTTSSSRTSSTSLTTGVSTTGATPTTTVSTSSTTTSASTGGGIPEFPSQLVSTAVFTVLLLTSFLLVRSRKPSSVGYG